METSGLRKDFKLREYQEVIIENILKEFGENQKRNVFISLSQGTGKTIIALTTLSRLVNENKVKKVLVLIPRRVLVNQWVDRAQEMFYGLGLMKNSSFSKNKIDQVRGWLKYSGAVGIAVTMQAFQSITKKDYFAENDFDLVIIDEAADLVISNDFIEGFRMSKYLKGLEKWQTQKLFLLPYHVKEKKILALVRKFGSSSSLIRKMVSETSLSCVIPDAVIIDDPIINVFVETLQENYKKTKTNVHRILNKFGIEGYRENIETLLSYDNLEKIKKIYGLDNETCQQIQLLIIKYILLSHIEKWFLYSNRTELARSLLSAQQDAKEWLSHEDKKLNKLIELVRDHIAMGRKIYIFSQYVATAELITDHLNQNLSLKPRDIEIITGSDDADMQFEKLESFKRVGKILVTTPVFDKGTDIPQADEIIVYTPPLSMEKLFQVVGRIRGGEVIFLAYKGYEQTVISQVIDILRKTLSRGEDEDHCG